MKMVCSEPWKTLAIIIMLIAMAVFMFLWLPTKSVKAYVGWIQYKELHKGAKALVLVRSAKQVAYRFSISDEEFLLAKKGDMVVIVGLFNRWGHRTDTELWRPSETGNILRIPFAAIDDAMGLAEEEFAPDK